VHSQDSNKGFTRPELHVADGRGVTRADGAGRRQRGSVTFLVWSCCRLELSIAPRPKRRQR